jgi:hypothetical protein
MGLVHNGHIKSLLVSLELLISGGFFPGLSPAFSLLLKEFVLLLLFPRRLLLENFRKKPLNRCVMIRKLLGGGALLGLILAFEPLLLIRLLVGEDVVNEDCFKIDLPIGRLNFSSFMNLEIGELDS